MGGGRFKTLTTPLNLPAGFRGTVVAFGYGAEERLFNTGNRPDDVAQLGLFDGACLTFVGGGRFGNAGEFPGTPNGGPRNRYAAGTFYFEPVSVGPTLSISRTGDKATLTWSGGGKLFSAPSVSGPWTEVPGATSAFEIMPTEAQAFYSIRL